MGRDPSINCDPSTIFSFEYGKINLIQDINDILDLETYQKRHTDIMLNKYQVSSSNIFTYDPGKVNLSQEFYVIYDLHFQ